MLETKFAPLDPEAGFSAVVSDGRISGYAALFDVADRSGDVIAPGAFADSLSRRTTPVKMLWQHDPARPIGVWETLREDPRGLWAEGRICLDCQAGAEAAALLSAGALDGLSIGYRVIEADQTPRGRRLTRVDLWEISLVTFPMVEAARVSTERAAAPPPAAMLARALSKARAALR